MPETKKHTKQLERLSALAPQPPSQSEILGLNSDTLSVDGGQVGVFKEGDKVGLSGLLQGHDGRGLEAEIGLEGWPRVSRLQRGE